MCVDNIESSFDIKLSNQDLSIEDILLDPDTLLQVKIENPKLMQKYHK